MPDPHDCRWQLGAETAAESLNGVMWDGAGALYRDSLSWEVT